MKMSVRAKRMQRNHKRMSQVSRLSLVSLMDIFTILVFFLMMNASDVQVLQTDKRLTLPKSVADTAARETLLLSINQQDIILQGRKLATVQQVMDDGQEIVPALLQELQYQASRQTVQTDAEVPVKAITVMADQSIPYALLKKIMQTCAQAGYVDVALAVEQQQQGEG
ncbi:biopolymer transporter ExbD [Bowmanella sp. JS7-9]|uniref:ExbD/TolR family protein n=1 Tax=Pseudobowmanella zhangzhouensis TaxID=1537679 RepID=A0ABW1XKG7_9ALTE|nr:biopolymer transporter ExbD [Bowmanella sp. JS7-9]TBX27246.1 RNA polymerase subunit sigma-70 [Bowmanella sp. JS7-9]